MQVTTELRPLFSYSFMYIIIIIIFIIIDLILIKFFKKQKVKEELIIPNSKDLMMIKNNYLSLVDNLLNDLKNNKITSRKAYQELSKIIRNFIYETTNIKVQYYTLKDISLINMPILYQLVSEYYDPEFSKISKGNILESINKTRMVIEKWH